MTASIDRTMPVTTGIADYAALLTELTSAARVASRVAMRASAADRTRALLSIASAIQNQQTEILQANRIDLDAYVGPEPLRDRLSLDEGRIGSMVSGLEELARQPDPVARVLDSWTRPNGLRIERVSAPIGVIGMIYESRPNVGVDAAGLCVRSGNAVILRGGSESRMTTTSLNQAIRSGLSAADWPEEMVQVVPTADRGMVTAMLAATGLIDLLIPRGGKSLVERVQREAKVPVLSHAEGICHSYVHRDADPEMAVNVLINAKLRRTSVCGATETLLIDKEVAPAWLPLILGAMADRGCSFRGDAAARDLFPGVQPAMDFGTEWQDAILSVAVVGGVDQAIAHIAHFGSGHTDAIITANEEVARHFLREVDSAVTLWNASTQFSDGAEFGFGAEIGISTGRLHARGPIGAAQLTTARYNVYGTGQVRP